MYGLSSTFDAPHRTQNGSTPLHTVVSHRGAPELAVLLLDRGAYVDDQAIDGTTGKNK